MNGRLAGRLARVRTPLLLIGVVLSFSARFHEAGWVGWAGLAMILAGLTLVLMPGGAVRRPPIAVRAPVEGRWMAVNSPADRVPSHGTHEFGQSHAIDLIYQPDPDVQWKSVRLWPPARRARSFPSYGRPILSPADAVVVRAVDGQRDHWSRNSWPGLAYLFLVEGIVRGIGAVISPRFVLGNHVILKLDEGVYAALAHLRRGSLRVRPGQRVRAGQQIAECGNSGNSAEPHLHFQLMDSPRTAIAAGLPFAFAYRIDGTEHYGVPKGRQAFTAGPAGRTGGPGRVDAGAWAKERG
ncbi:MULTISPECIES: M23 family metallopeptidase [Thermomonospora]|uniref:Peptidase M23 n=1 Tax=Thermomonospora curvata (strain ATCC 19995 / DSM 43183 / JCM 3096 / KCTC 9072 / NBRC 15933 / NCIMB 10081 / Henssen B9) TaxID=471852 RepID=D1A1T3_THECD|nr:MULTISPECIES: M23 family metallopeptidase [Thermomonospora]ACY97771.1 Peptidase M23 [Thermomonospora curvata DSM 43183]PKK14067.1 MAG: M23 family peptidase [Thermomonospora sp. CIF 1]